MKKSVKFIDWNLTFKDNYLKFKDFFFYFEIERLYLRLEMQVWTSKIDVLIQRSNFIFALQTKLIFESNRLKLEIQKWKF